jgi:hypothetical protein
MTELIKEYWVPESLELLENEEIGDFVARHCVQYHKAQRSQEEPVALLISTDTPACLICWRRPLDHFTYCL